MLDFNHVLATPGADIQYFEGPATTTLLQWQVWRKPRGARWIHLLGVGGGGGGGAGINTTTTSGGGAGGSSGGQTTVMIPAMFVPDTLYIQAGAGGAGATTTAGLGLAGIITYVCIAPYTTIAPAGTLLLATGGTAGTAVATATTGGAAPGAVAAATIAGMCLAGRGFYTLLAGQVGIAGAASTLVGSPLTPPTTGLMVTGGGGGGGCNGATGFAGGSISAISGALSTNFFPLPRPGGTAAVTITPAGAAGAGFISKNSLFNFGGGGGGGATTTAGGRASAGGDGAPGCGGGGGGGMNTTNNTIARGGNGGPGFVYIITT
jgi:hypothetical protein